MPDGVSMRVCVCVCVYDIVCVRLFVCLVACSFLLLDVLVACLVGLLFVGVVVRFCVGLSVCSFVRSCFVMRLPASWFVCLFVCFACSFVCSRVR